MRTVAVFFALASALAGFGCRSQDQAPPGAQPPADSMLQRYQSMAARFAPVDLTADVSSLPANEQQALTQLIEAAQIFDSLFMRQVWAGNESMLVALTREVRLALACSAEVQARSSFARKAYFYPDLPKGYQITQHERPLALHGRLALAEGTSAERVVPIARIHVEEDAGKSLHDLEPDRTLLDYNRSGVALAELVTEPREARVDLGDRGVAARDLRAPGVDEEVPAFRPSSGEDVLSLGIDLHVVRPQRGHADELVEVEDQRRSQRGETPAGCRSGRRVPRVRPRP